MNLILLLHRGHGPGFVDFLCHNHQDHILGVVVLLHHIHGPFLTYHLQQDHMSGLLLLLRHSHGLGLVFLLYHTRFICPGPRRRPVEVVQRSDGEAKTANVLLLVGDRVEMRMRYRAAQDV